MRALPRSERSSTRPLVPSGTVRRNSFDGAAPLRPAAMNKEATVNEVVRDTILLPSDSTQQSELMFINVEKPVAIAWKVLRRACVCVESG